ncbi:MAG: SMC family ATPase [Negativicutes bacterium]|nr:SMC family ATPase [Negativicutes bacterium]
MRPIKLTMTAFGPYAAEQVIDFAELNGRNIFLITGPTGAGKTTIFDAICYAIYGKGSGGDRDGENMRSDFAGDDMPTVVELEFELGGRRYSVRRKPRQLKRKAKGEGYTEQAAEAEFRELTGGGAVIAGVREVNEKIQQIMNISYEQFRQIIMIPQGEFRELLTAESKDREIILQRIFGTEGFRRVQEQLGEWERTLRDEIKSVVAQRDQSLRALDAGGSEKLAALIALPSLHTAAILEEASSCLAQDEALQHELQALAEAQEALAAAKQQEIFRAHDINRKLAARDEAARRKEMLESQLAYYQAEEDKLQLGRKALTLRGLEENASSRRDAAARRAAQLAAARQQAELLAAEAAASQSAYDAELSREPLRAKLRERLTVLKGFGEKVKTLAAARSGHAQAVHALKQAEQAVQKTKAEAETLRAEISAVRQKLEAAQAAAAACAQCQAELEICRDNQERALRLKDANEQLAALRRLFEQKQKALRQERERLESRQRTLEHMKAEFMRGQAGILAQALVPGKSCPVCGSCEHPAPAALADGMPSEAQLQEAEAALRRQEERFEAVRAEYEQVRAEGLAQRSVAASLQQELSRRLGEEIAGMEQEALAARVDKETQKLAAQIQALAAKAAALEALRQQEPVLARSLGELESKLAAAAEKLERLTDSYRIAFGEEQALQKTLTDLMLELPEEFRDERRLAAEIAGLEQQIATSQEALAAAEAACRQGRLEYEKKRTEQELLEAAYEEALADAEAAAAGLMTGIAAAGFADFSAYEEARLDERQIEALEHSIRVYREQLNLARESWRSAEAEAAGMLFRDTATLEDELAAIQQEKKALHEKRTIVFARLKTNRDLLSGIRELERKLSKKEQEYGIVAELANTAKGNNEERLSFERYVLAAFFEDIISAANLRLHKMTGGRYEMSRIAGKGKGAAQSGLELEVFDNYTGRARHIKTLSGGESFKASLALALGLADVVQACAGGISLETMFIDEGFGTLDPESLDSAINCLIELQHSGRLVGIISHVPELKNSIDARLEIEAGKAGSRASFCIL